MREGGGGYLWDTMVIGTNARTAANLTKCMAAQLYTHILTCTHTHTHITYLPSLVINQLVLVKYKPPCLPVLRNK